MGDGCVYYDGNSNDRTYNNISISSGAYTISFWAKFDDETISSSNMEIASIGDLRAVMWPGNYMGAVVRNVAVQTAKSTDTASDISSWHLYTITIENSGSYGIPVFYIDGKQLGDSVKTNYQVRDTTSARIDVAYAYPGNQSFKGFIDDLRIWNRALSADEIEVLYNFL